MHALFIALGSAAAELAHADLAEMLGIPSTVPHRVIRHGNDFLGVVCTPHGSTPEVAVNTDCDASVLLDGYTVANDHAVDENANMASRLLSRILAAKNIEAALESYSAGSFNLAYAEGRTRTFEIASDRIGSIPLYYASPKDGFLVSTNPLSILATGLVDRELDWTACASWIYFGYPLGQRHILRDVRLFPSHSLFRWKNGQGQFIHLANDPVLQLPRPPALPTDAMASLVRNACARVSKASGPLAHLQSAGMDSRLILASLPEGVKPPCFTYGRPQSTDVPIAEQVARTGGSPFHHYWPDGDVVANSLDAMFRANGLMVYPDRYLIAMHMAQSGFRSVTDGRLGGVLLGGEYYKGDRQHGSLSRLGRLATYFVDQSVSRLGMDKVATGIFDQISEVRSLSSALPFLSQAFVGEMEARRMQLLEDIRDECQILEPENDSLAILYRRFLMQNRGRKAISQQGVMCRQFLQVLYPLSNDWELLDACQALEPRRTAYRRYYIRLFRHEYPTYAALPYGSSLTPVSKSPWIHDYHKLLAKVAAKNRMVKRFSPLVPVSQNNWSTWMRDSPLLREKLTHYLCQSGIAEPDKLKKYLLGISRGDVSATGKLFHVAAIAQWMTMPSRARSPAHSLN